jgi:hypothetical protein
MLERSHVVTQVNIPSYSSLSHISQICTKGIIMEMDPPSLALLASVLPLRKAHYACHALSKLLIHRIHGQNEIAVNV